MSDSLLLLRRIRDRSAATSPLPPQPTSPPPLPPPPPSPPTSIPILRRKRGRRRRFYPEHRVYRTRSSFLDLTEEQVLRRYRLDKAAIAGLCRELGADLESLTGRSHALPVAVKVTSALTFLASGSFQTATRDTTGISQSAMSNCLAQFLEALQRRAARYIAFPSPGRSAPQPGPFPGVLGLLGSMHVALRAPSENELAFRNARNFHSMNMQVVCDEAGAITNVVAKFPGSCPNAAVLENSALARLLDGTRPEGVWLLGDRSYPLKTWLMTPILFPCGPAEERYNALHHQALSALRQTLSLLKRRFRCLDAAGGCLQYAPQKVCQIFLACCVLHNIALRRRMPLEPPDGPEPDPEPELPLQAPHVQISSEARAVRARIVQQPPQHGLQLPFAPQHRRVQPPPRLRLPTEGNGGREPPAPPLEEAVGVGGPELHPLQQSQQLLPVLDQSGRFVPQLQSIPQPSPRGRKAVFGGHGQPLARGDPQGGPEAVQAVLQLLRLRCRGCRWRRRRRWRRCFCRPPRVLIRRLPVTIGPAEVEDGVEEVGAGGCEEVPVVLQEGCGLRRCSRCRGGGRTPPGLLLGSAGPRAELGGCRFQERLRIREQLLGGQRRAQLTIEIPESLGGVWDGVGGLRAALEDRRGLRCGVGVQWLCRSVGVH
eukprot:XP_025001366.1 uncharacterized protein LOC101751955 isoform X2 [Gallus gallus]